LNKRKNIEQKIEFGNKEILLEQNFERLKIIEEATM
jgi:hypothetical protein